MLLATYLTVMVVWFPVLSVTAQHFVVPLTNKTRHGQFMLPTRTKNNTERVYTSVITNPARERVELTISNVTDNCSGEYSRNKKVWLQGDYSIVRTYCVGPYASEKLIVLESRVINVTYEAKPSTSHGNEIDSVTENSIAIRYRVVEEKTCRYTLQGDNGTFESPRLASGLEMDCKWLISTDKSKTITLTLNLTQDGSGCADNNYIEVRDGDEQHGTPVARLCHNKAHHITSKTSTLIIIAKNMSNVHFTATYSTHDRCPRGKRTFNFYPPTDHDCREWVFTAAPANMAAVLSFAGMNLESTSDDLCTGNLVEVWDGEKTSVYCNNNHPPQVIISEQNTLRVTYRSVGYREENSFKGSFASVRRSEYSTRCFVYNSALHYKCGDQRLIPCEFLCDGAIQCRDNSDESVCPEMEARWKKLQVFVIIMGSVCASTVIFCIGLVCFRRFILRSNQLTDSRGRRCSSSSHRQLTPNPDLPSPPPHYFNDNDIAPPSISSGTYFFGNQFSQSGIHSASLFGIPPPRYRSTESLRQPFSLRDIQGGHWSPVALVPTDFASAIPLEDPPQYQLLPYVKNNGKSNNCDVVPEEQTVAESTNPSATIVSTSTSITENV